MRGEVRTGSAGVPEVRPRRNIAFFFFPAVGYKGSFPGSASGNVGSVITMGFPIENRVSILRALRAAAGPGGHGSPRDGEAWMKLRTSCLWPYGSTPTTRTPSKRPNPLSLSPAARQPCGAHHLQSGRPAPCSNWKTDIPTGRHPRSKLECRPAGQWAYTSVCYPHGGETVPRKKKKKCSCW